MHRVVALFALVSVLAACGGGDGGGGSTTVIATPPSPVTPAVPAAPPISVGVVSPPAYGPEDCARFTRAGAALAALDLAEPNLRALHDYLEGLDATNALQVFARRPYDFVNWIARAGGTVDLRTLPGAMHETMHMVDDVLVQCVPAGTYKTLFMGTVLATRLRLRDTPNVKVVDAVIAPALKSHFRYATYITGAAPDNDFTILLGELAAYTAAAHTELRMLQAGQYLSAGGDAQMGGSLAIMVYVQNYLRAVRASHPAAWEAIRGEPANVAALQAIWSRAEQTLRDGFAFTQPGAAVQMRVDAAYFDAAYSADLLAQLDALGVTHAARSEWAASYLR